MVYKRKSRKKNILEFECKHYGFGKCFLKEYNCWRSMIYRCHTDKHPSSPYYYGRGITVCDEWRNSFLDFLVDMGRVPEGKSIDRIDFKKGYCFENCRWATKLEQLNNTCANRFLTFDGRTQSISRWADEVKIDSSTITNRINNGWATEVALTKPPINRKKIECNGESHSLTDWAKKVGISRSLITKRLKSGWTIEDALFTPVESKTILVEYNGKKYTINELSKLANISYSYCLKQFKNGLSAEDIINIKKK